MMLIVCGDRIGERMAGPSIRAWEIARALHARGLPVTLAAPGRPEREAPFPLLGYDARGARLREAAEEADAIFVQGLSLAQYPFLAALDTPLAVDLYDPFVLENLPARVGDTPAGRVRGHATDLAALNEQLLRGDFFVCASEVQRDYWLGCLTALGRVNPRTYDQNPDLRGLLGLLPFGLPEEPPRPPDAPVLRGVLPGIGPQDEIVLWGGGIWDWLDPLTLIRAVGRLAAERPRLRLYFMGTRSPSLYSPKRSMADRAIALAEEMGLRDRAVFFHEGWVPYEARVGFLLESDLGTSFHLPHLETRFAFRTRLLDCFWTGLPMLAVEGDVLSARIAELGLGLVVPPGDVDATAAALVALLDAPGGRAAYAERFAAAREAMTWARATEDLAAFAAAPAAAPDRAAGEGGEGGAAAQVTRLRDIPARGLELLGEGGPLLLAEEAVRYLRWLRRPK